MIAACLRSATCGTFISVSRLLSASVPDESGRLGTIQDDLQALTEAQGIGPEDVEDLIDELRAEERSRQS